ncbi:AI-2E family transporter [Dielma fastidiosa]|uniref:AI-2E family transporter n=1 Tax=Dielma fastidiosa TaxID=1034346 RepID=UPI003FEEF918
MKISISILKMPYALLIGILIAFTALVPIFGAFIGCAVGSFLIFMVNPKQAVLFIIVFLLLQQIEGNLIYPHVVGGSVGLPSIWVLAAVTIGGNLMGIIGNKADMTVENTSASQIAPVRQDRIRNPFSFFCSIIFSPPCIQFHALLRFQNQGYL